MPAYVSWVGGGARAHDCRYLDVYWECGFIVVFFAIAARIEPRFYCSDLCRLLLAWFIARFRVVSAIGRAKVACRLVRYRPTSSFVRNGFPIGRSALWRPTRHQVTSSLCVLIGSWFGVVCYRDRHVVRFSILGIGGWG